jgi:hypothetical protein
MSEIQQRLELIAYYCFISIFLFGMVAEAAQNLLF